MGLSGLAPGRRSSSAGAAWLGSASGLLHAAAGARGSLPLSFRWTGPARVDPMLIRVVWHWSILADDGVFSIGIPIRVPASLHLLLGSQYFGGN